jgi:PAS domain S-box-containing protein
MRQNIAALTTQQNQSIQQTMQAAIRLFKTPAPVHLALQCLALAAIYFLSAEAGLLLAFVQENATPAWPPTGIALAALLLRGKHLWPGVFLGAFVVNIFTDASFLVALGIAGGNTLEAVVGAGVIGKLTGTNNPFASTKNAFISLLTILLVATPLSATVGTLSLFAGGLLDNTLYSSVWGIWWLGDATGAAVVAPLLIACWEQHRDAWSTLRKVEFAAMLVATVTLSQVIFKGGLADDYANAPLAFVVLPLLIWAAFRFEQLGSTTAIGLISIISISGTINGYGPFAHGSVNQSILFLQAFIGLIAISTLVLSAVIRDRRATEAALKAIQNGLTHRIEERTAALRESNHALAESEEKWRAVVTNVPDLILLAHNEGNVEFINRPTDGLGGQDQDPAELHIFLDRDKIIHPLVLQNLGQVFDHGKEVTFDTTHRSETGKTHHHMVRIAPLYEKQIITNALVVITDTTARKHTEEKRIQLNRQMLHAQKMQALGSLTGGIAHDFNNILAAILGYSELAMEVRDTDPEDSIDDYLREIHRAGERARDLVRQMLSYSRGQSGNFEPVTLGPLVTEIVRMVRSTLPASITINTRISDQRLALRADPVMLHQTIVNLCINARDAIDGNGDIDIAVYRKNRVDSECSACHKPVHGEFMELAVTDTGQGINPEVLAQIFDPFFSTKTLSQGTGMGLATVHGIVHEHDGHIVVETRPGSTTFRLLFPAERITSDTIAAAEPKHATAAR